MSNFQLGIIGAMDAEVEGLIERLENLSAEEICGVKFYTGTLFGKSVVVAKCGVGKVFASVCAAAMIIRYAPQIIVNTGVGGALAPDLGCTDVVVASKLVQHDMDTSALGDPKGMVSGINKVFFDGDSRANAIILDSADRLSVRARAGIVATGDVFVSSVADKERIVSLFGADVCEMEGAAIAQTCYAAGVPCAVIRSISDGADGNSPLDFPSFLKVAVKNSLALTCALIENF